MWQDNVQLSKYDYSTVESAEFTFEFTKVQKALNYRPNLSLHGALMNFRGYEILTRSGACLSVFYLVIFVGPY